jgi:hypothetical protein
MTPKSVLALLFCSLAALSCSDDEGDTSLSVTWTFASGDCTSNGVETVRVSWGPAGGPFQDVDFPCASGGGKVGSTAENGGSYFIDAEGFNANGVAVVESYGVSATFSGPMPGGHSIDVTLHPKGVDVVVSWSLSSGGVCPPGVVLPYFVTLYKAPATAGGALTDSVANTQETCSAGQTTLTGIVPGSYVVEIDSRAVTPAVRGTAPVTVEPGQNAEVLVEL